MIEANDNIDLVTMRRRQDLQRARDSYQRAVSEGRLAVRPRAAERAQLEVAANASHPSPGVAGTVEVVPATALPADPEAAWRHTRLAITAGLVVLLLVVWIWQKKAGR